MSFDYIVEACLYGDAEGVVMTYNRKQITCSFEDISDDPSVCYHVKDKCCQQCRHFYTGIAGLNYHGVEPPPPPFVLRIFNPNNHFYNLLGRVCCLKS